MLDPHLIIIASVVSFISSWFGSLAGGGGLIIVPVLLALGLPVPIALGTRRFSSLGGIITGLIQFHRWKKVDYNISFSLVLFTLIGCILGYIIVETVTGAILKNMIGLMIIALTIILFFERTDKIQKIKGSLYIYRNIIGPPVAILASIIAIIVGGAGGTIMTYLLIIVYGQTILQSSGSRRLPMLAGHILAVILFMSAGYVYYPLAFSLLAANALGQWFGSRFYLKKGDEKVRIFFYVIMVLLGIKTMLP